ncbi:hypothetical protein KHA80_15080 [Anaerobacillus sp. HL2]|nr:hypothetical protein KHA80_15080 [Anaerobacillus sp. HL2]
MIIMAISVAMGVGGSSVISRRLGEKRTDEANLVFGNIVSMVILVSIIGFIGAFITLEPMLIFYLISTLTILDIH